MSEVLKIFLSMSFSGGVLILAMLLGKHFWKDKISRQWQYYIWLVAVLRLLIPFGPETNLMGRIYQAVDQAVTRTASLPQPQNAFEANPVYQSGKEQVKENVGSSAKEQPVLRLSWNMRQVLTDYIWLVWLAAALGLLIRKVTIYQDFVRYIKAGLTQVSDTEILDRLSGVAERAGIRRPIELCVNPLVSSPLLIGFFCPCIVLPKVDISERDFQYIVLHELTHYKRRDMFYKWLVQITVCMHWFNPLVHLMCREITKACEFSCDEAVLEKTGCDSAQDYGKTLLDAMAAVGRYRENLGAVTLSENKRLLKERLGAIMNFRRKTKAMRFLTGALTLGVICGAAFLGVYSVAEASGQEPGKLQVSDLNGENALPTQGEAGTHSDRYALMAEKYYEAGSLPLFQLAFLQLDEEAQGVWLDRIYADGDIAFMGAAVNLLAEDCALIPHLAETIYEDGDISFFSVLTMHMGEDALEDWLDRALEDEKWSFQSVLFKALDRDKELDEREQEWEEMQRAEYQAAGVTTDGKNYYYQGQLARIFLDIRANKSFYTLNMNPKGTVNIKIIRDADNKITGVAYMTEAEVTELFGNMSDDD